MQHPSRPDGKPAAPVFKGCTGPCDQGRRPCAVPEACFCEERDYEHDAALRAMQMLTVVVLWAILTLIALAWWFL